MNQPNNQTDPVEPVEGRPAVEEVPFPRLAHRERPQEAARQLADRAGKAQAELEAAIAAWKGSERAVLFPTGFAANLGVFEALASRDAFICSDELNHASIIDGIRLCKAQRFRYRNNDMADLEARLKEAAGARFRLVATDGVFSMRGDHAPLEELRALADEFADAYPEGVLLVVDDSLTVRQAKRQMLENAGYAVDVAIDGMEGWSAVRIGAYDLVVTDQKTDADLEAETFLFVGIIPDDISKLIKTENDVARIVDWQRNSALLQHVMETGYRPGLDGKVVPRDIVHRFSCSFSDGATIEPVFGTRRRSAKPA